MRGWFAIVVVAAVLGLLAAAPARAAKEGDKPEQHPQQEHKEHADESFFGRALDLGIWTVVVFLVLLFVLKKYAWKPMLEGLDKREREIHAAVEESRKAREEAQALHQQLEAERIKGAEQVRAMLDEARRDAERLRDQRKAEAEAEIQAERDRLRRELATARDQVLKETLDTTAQLATMVAAKAIRRQLTADIQRDLVDEALGDMKRALQHRNGGG